MRLAFALVLCAACAARTEIRDTPLDAGSSAADAAHVARDYKVAYLTGGGGGPIWVWHSRDGSIEQMIPAAPTLDDFTYDGRFMPIVRDTQIDIVDTHGAVVRSQAMPPACATVRVANPRPDAARLIVSAESDSGTGCFGTLDASGAYDELDTTKYMAVPRYSPDGTTLLFSEEVLEGKTLVEKLMLMNDDGSNRVVLAEHAGMATFSFDGKRIAYTEGQRIVTMDLASREVTAIVDVSGQSQATAVTFPFFTPDGQAIVFEETTAYGKASLRRIDLTTHETATLIEPFGSQGYLTGASITLAADE